MDFGLSSLEFDMDPMRDPQLAELLDVYHQLDGSSTRDVTRHEGADLGGGGAYDEIALLPDLNWPTHDGAHMPISAARSSWGGRAELPGDGGAGALHGEADGMDFPSAFPPFTYGGGLEGPPHPHRRSSFEADRGESSAGAGSEEWAGAGSGAGAAKRKPSAARGSGRGRCGRGGGRGGAASGIRGEGSGRGSSASVEGGGAAASPRPSSTAASDSDGAGRSKGRRFLWTEDLHRRFVVAIFDYGVKSATPKTLFELMQPAPEGMSSDNIKSHLQKFRNNSRAGREAFMREFERTQADAEAQAEDFLARTGQQPFPVHFSTYPLSVPAGGNGAHDESTCGRCERYSKLIELGVGLPEGEEEVEMMRSQAEELGGRGATAAPASNPPALQAWRGKVPAVPGGGGQRGRASENAPALPPAAIAPPLLPAAPASAPPLPAQQLLALLRQYVDAAGAGTGAGAGAAAQPLLSESALTASQPPLSYADLLRTLNRTAHSSVPAAAPRAAVSSGSAAPARGGGDAFANMSRAMAAQMRLHRAMLHRQEGQLVQYGGGGESGGGHEAGAEGRPGRKGSTDSEESGSAPRSNGSGAAGTRPGMGSVSSTDTSEAPVSVGDVHSAVAKGGAKALGELFRSRFGLADLDAVGQGAGATGASFAKLEWQTADGSKVSMSTAAASAIGLSMGADGNLAPVAVPLYAFLRSSAMEG